MRTDWCSAGNIQIVYDGDGNRVQENVGGTNTFYQVAEINPTGYAQVLEERPNTLSSSANKVYVWGLQLVAMADESKFPFVDPSPLRYYGYDGHGSVRFLIDPSGKTTDTYDYDAFGNLIAQTATTQNNYLFAGEQFDPALGVYYKRARYYDERLGRFWTADTFEGSIFDPPSLHKYLYANANPANRADRSGNFTITDAVATVQTILISVAQAFPTITALARVGVALVNAYFLFSEPQYAFTYFNGLGPAEALRALYSDYLVVSDAAGAFRTAAFVPRQFFSVFRLSLGRGLVLDIGGGLRSPVPNAINIDPRAEQGIKSSADVLEKVVPGRASRIYVTNPQFSFLEQSSRALQPGGQLIVSGTARNTFLSDIVSATDESLAQYQLRIVSENGPLPPELEGGSFSRVRPRSDGSTAIDPASMRTTILQKY